jgi:hypothetical protein
VSKINEPSAFQYLLLKSTSAFASCHLATPILP